MEAINLKEMKESRLELSEKLSHTWRTFPCFRWPHVLFSSCWPAAEYPVARSEPRGTPPSALSTARAATAANGGEGTALETDSLRKPNPKRGLFWGWVVVYGT